MTSSCFRSALAGTAFTLLALPLAAQDSTPSGPWTSPEQTISLEAFLSNDQLADQLQKIADRSKGVVQLEIAGASGMGNPIMLVKIGDPANMPVLIFTQQHGDEPHGTEAAMSVIRKLATGSAEAQRILDEVYVLVMPRVNPDGSAIPTRGNADFSAPASNTRQCPAAGGSSATGRGIFTTRFRDTDDFSYDVNRYHWGDWTDSWQYLCNPDGMGGSIYPVNPVPEAQAVLDTYFTYLPVWALDIHNQGFNVVDDETCDSVAYCRDGQYVTGSILWPTNEDVAEEVRDYSKQLALVMKKRSMEIGNVELTRYNGGSFAGIARNAYGLRGTERLTSGETGPLGGSILFEVAGQIEGSVFINNGQKAIGKLRSGVTKIMMSMLEATADGSVLEEDPAEAEVIILDNDTFLVNPLAEEE